MSFVADLRAGNPAFDLKREDLPRSCPETRGYIELKYERTLVVMTAPMDPVVVYEQTRRWGNHVPRIGVEIRRRWNRWMMRHGGGDECRLRCIALEHGLDHVPKAE